MATSHARAPALDGIRGLAAIAVMMFHMGLDLHLPWCVGHGWLAVDVFFVMSGFVVERAYGERLRNGWPAWSFASVRFRRLYPLYLFGLGLGATLYLLVLSGKGLPIAADAFVVSTVAGILLVPLMLAGSDQVFPLNGPSWSLFVEVVANAGFALLNRRLGRWCLLPLGTAAAIIVVAAIVGRPMSFGGRPGSLWLDVARGTFGFGVGAAMGLAVRRGGLGWVPRLPVLCVFTGLVAMLLVRRGPQDAWFDPLAIIVLCPALVAAAVASRPGLAMSRFCAQAVALSYPLYVVHAPILYAAHRIIPEGSGTLVQLSITAAAGAAALLLAWTLARWKEPGSSRISGPAPAAAATPALTPPPVEA